MKSGVLDAWTVARLRREFAGEFHAGDQIYSEKVVSAVAFVDDGRYPAGRDHHQLRVVHAHLPPVGHVDPKRLEWPLPVMFAQRVDVHKLPRLQVYVTAGIVAQPTERVKGARARYSRRAAICAMKSWKR